MNTLVILPTYNERETLPRVMSKILELEGFDILVVDDNSRDGTGEVAAEWAARDARVHLLRRPAKLGLGTAYTTGFRWGLERNYDCMVEMDSDLSHDPADLTRLAAEIQKGCGLVIGSRYIGGKISVVGWDFHRLLLSRFGNFYASRILRVPLTDLTGGFRAFGRKALERIDLERIHSEGYAFQIEMAYYVWRSGLGVREIPIIFTERERGSSKMSKKIIREAVWLPWRLRFNNLVHSLKRLVGIGRPGRFVNGK